MQLPSDLKAAMEHIAADLTDEAGKRTSQAVSERYRDKHRQAAEVMVGSRMQAAAYAATRMPATWAAMRACMVRICEILPAFRPRSILDVGAGTGAAMWAAADTWPELNVCLLTERSDGMTAVGRQMASLAGSAAVRNAVWRQQDLLHGLDGESADLVTAGWVLNELGDAALGDAVETLWEATAGVLLVAEPGTPEGFGRMLRIRDRLLGLGACLVGPCPHTRACPVAVPDWCHFAERINRIRPHRQLKGAELAYEDEKYCWLAVSRNPAEAVPALIRRHPEIHGGFIRLALCTEDGLRAETVTRSDGPLWRQARNAGWGDAWPGKGRRG